MSSNNSNINSTSNNLRALGQVFRLERNDSTEIRPEFKPMAVVPVEAINNKWDKNVLEKGSGMVLVKILLQGQLLVQVLPMVAD